MMRRLARRPQRGRKGQQKASSGAPGRASLLKVELCSDPKLLSVIRAAAEQLSSIVGFAAPDCRSIVRALDEALANIIRHCYCGEMDRPITVEFRSVLEAPGGVNRQGLEIVLTDRGPRIDRAALKGRELSDVRPGGLGLHLIHQAMETVQFSRSNGRNQLRLVKYVHGDSDHHQAV
jgi:serine/threonine-protein kinase RsbW